MPARAAQRLLLALSAPALLLVALVATASPAAAHNTGSSGSLPAPSWLLGYIGAFAVLASAVALRSSWTTARLPAAAPDTPDEPGRAPLWGVGQLVGLALLVGVIVAALVGPNSPAGNIAPVAVNIVWWVALPLLCLVFGDVMAAFNPFAPVVAVLERVVPDRVRSAGPAPVWTGAAFLLAFRWLWVSYYRPGSPRAVAAFLILYSLAAVAGGLRWGRSWLATGEGFAGLSAGIARLTRRRSARPVPGLLAIVVVWVGTTAFDDVKGSDFWIDVLGATRGWGRTLIDTVGLVWLTASVAAIAMVALRIAEASRTRAVDDGDEVAPRRGTTLVPLLGIALVPLGLGWFVAHDLSLLLFEGQNFVALLSDPLGKGWDLFGTIDRTIDYKIVDAGWVRWVELLALLGGHVGAVVLAHDSAIAHLGRRRGMRVTWTVAVLAAASVVAAALLVLQ